MIKYRIFNRHELTTREHCDVFQMLNDVCNAINIYLINQLHYTLYYIAAFAQILIIKNNTDQKFVLILS